MEICISGTLQVLNFFFLKRTSTSAFESGSIGPFKLYWFMTYTSAFVNARIGTAYASAFRSVGINLLNYIDSRLILALSKALVYVF